MSERWEHPPLDRNQPGPFLEALRSFLDRRSDIGIVFPIDQEEVDFFSHHRDRIPGVVTVLASDRAVKTCLSKSLLLELFRTAGVPHARSE